MRKPTTISFVIHLVLLLMLAFWPDWHRRKPPKYISIAIAQAAPQPETPKEQPQPKDVKPPPKPPDTPKKVVKTTPKVDPNKEALDRLRKLRKQRKKSALPTPTPNRKRRPTPLPTRSPKFTSITDVKPQAQPTAAPSQETSAVTIAGFQDQGYQDRLTRAILREWNKPSVRTKADFQKSGTIEFEIRPSGRFIKIRIISSSGWDDLDQSVLQAVEDLESFEEPPKDRGNLNVRYRFRLSEDGA